MNLPQNLFEGNMNVQTFLCQPDKEIMGEILPYDFNATFKFNTYSEISFTIDKYYNDLFDGKTKIHPYYEWVESLRVIYLRGIGHFVIQDVDESEGDAYTKSVTCYSLEYSTGQKYLENFYVNTGEEGSIETMYHAQQYGAEYSIDNYYTLADSFDAYERYYIKQYSNDGGVSYNYVEEQVLDADDFNTYNGENSETTLYVKKYPNVRFYWPTKPELSLLHHVFDRIPEWKIGHVDKELWYQERTFSEDRTAVYDFLYNTAAKTLKFVMVWDSINGVVNFYKAEEDGVTTDTYVRTNIYNSNFIYYSDTHGTVANPQPTSENEVINGIFYINVGDDIETQWDTDVFISRENLASELDIKYSTDDIKTKLKITGSDNLDVRDVNLGQNYVLNLSYYNTPLWLGEDLHLKYNAYTNDLAQYTSQYKEFISAWSAAYNEYSDLMNYVPVEPRVMLVGDVFEKLYCVYNKYKPASKEFKSELTYYKYDTKTLTYYTANPQPTTDQDLKDGQYYVIQNLSIEDEDDPVQFLVERLQTRLNLYKVDQNDNGTRSQIAKTDDVLLTLENDASDSVTIRVRYTASNTNDKPAKTDYRVWRTLTVAATGISNTIEYNLYDWVNGTLTANALGLEDENIVHPFRIKSIGALGAYFCLVRDETIKANLEDYGIRLLQEKQDTYTKVFITQTEGYMNKEGSQCIASNELPTGNEYPDGTKWLDTENTNPDGSLIMKIRRENQWVDYTPDGNDYEDYARFEENYKKLGNVQAVLAEKQRIADYLLNGVAMTNRRITKENINSANLLTAAQDHFPNQTIILTEYNAEFGFVSFTIASDTENEYAAYVIDGTPHISYVHSQGLCLAKMNVIKEASDMNNYFTEQELVRLSPFIREDEYSDDNFLLTGYESEEEQMNIKQELLNAGDEELKKICQPKLSFDATMANILAIPEFAPLKKQFKLGNFVRVGIREGYVKRARLLEVQINFDDPSDFSATFGDLISTRSEVDKHSELLQQAVTAGQSVAANASKWQKGADKATKLDQAINDGLRNVALSVGAADGQAIVWDKYGIRGRKLRDGTTDEYEPEQFALINNKLVFTDDNWETSRAVVGEFEIELPNASGAMVKQNMYGLLADAIVGGYIQGTEIHGGKLEIGGAGGKFIVNEDGSVEIKTSTGSDVYAQTGAVTAIDAAYKYSIQIEHTGKAVFSSKSDTATMTAHIYRRGVDATENFQKAGVTVNWEKNPSSEGWTPQINGDSYSIILKSEDVQNSAQISCYIDPTEEQITQIESNYND